MSQTLRPWLRDRLLACGYELGVAAHPHGGPTLAHLPSRLSSGQCERSHMMKGGLVQVSRFLTFALGQPDKEEALWLVASDPTSHVVVCLTAKAVGDFHRYV